MAQEARRKSKAKFIAITGSVGKTGTKEIFRTCFSKLKNIYVNESSFNNHIGVPVSLSRVPASTKFCMLEIGMNRLGEIKNLSNLVKPEVAIITAIEKSHLEGVKTLKNIALAKSEIIESLSTKGCLIYNEDTNFSKLLLEKAKKYNIENIISYGTKSSANIQLIECKTINNSYAIKVKYFGKVISWNMPLIGEHWIKNSLSIIALAVYLKLDIKSLVKELNLFKVPSGRGNLLKLKLKSKRNKFFLINDSYNSNPASLSASIENLSNITNKGKKILVLGDMLELGKESISLHIELKNKIENNNINLLFTHGKYMKYLNNISLNISKKFHIENLDRLSSILIKHIEDEDVVLIKGSNSMNLNEIVKKILVESEPQ